MPTEPPGEADLRALARRYMRADAGVSVLLAEAAVRDRRGNMTQALDELAALRRLDHRKPVVTAYLKAFRQVRGGGDARAVQDLAASLAHKLDQAAQSAADAVRQTFPKVTTENIAEMAEMATVAYVDRRGGQWGLGHWAMTNCDTLGRQATSRGLTDAVGNGAKVMIEVSGCDYCQEFEGEATIGTDPLPPFHPSCTCVAISQRR